MTAADVTVLGAGAAGIFAALAARGAIAADGTSQPPDPQAPNVRLVDGQEAPGRKILISGGGRCNVTNEAVTADDFITSDPRLVRNALREFGPDAARTFFASRGVALHVESLGKVFPDSGRARDVLAALLSAAEDAGVATRFGTAVRSVTPTPDGRWEVDGEPTSRIIVATGGLSIPATGSTGFGYGVAQAAGHDLVDRVPALAPLEGAIGSDDLAGTTLPATVVVRDASGRETGRASGSALFTHHGLTGPAALDVSHAVEIGLAGGSPPGVYADLWTLSDPDGPMGPHLGDPKLPGCSLAQAAKSADPSDLDAWLAAAAERDPRATVASVLSPRLARRLVVALLGEVATTPLGQLRRDHRRAVAQTITRLDLGVTGTSGYRKAEVTAGGVRLAELDRRTLESKLAPGLSFCGEVCDVTGRLGGFNFQWAWTSGYLAGRGAAKDR